MFKIESYVTPILLSYVDKYVRDFKPADAQVSLWGGGVALHNLVLKADVLQNEVALPFKLVSGRIHELLIQVPWTKIMSDPIVVTIDTIECIFCPDLPTAADENVQEDLPSKTQVVEAPPGYMQALVRRIVNNISLRVHHLIVKYVQDDVVLSLNVKHLSVDSAGPDWEAAFADIDQSEPLIRRLVRLDDLTLCLDRADSDGKIRYYQEPLLYRCQLNLRVWTRLVSASSRRASNLSIQLRSSKLAWGVTNEQLALLIRLLDERRHMQARAPPPPPKPAAAPPPTNNAEPARSGSWSEWAWSWVPSFMDSDGLEAAAQAAVPTPVYFSAFLDHVSLVFKMMETDSSNRKRARGVLEVRASHAAARAVSCAPTALRVRAGIRRLRIQSHGKCVCGRQDVTYDIEEPTVYLGKRDNKPEDDEVDENWTWPYEVFEDKVELAEAAEEEDLPEELQTEEVQLPTPSQDAPENASSTTQLQSVINVQMVTVANTIQQEPGPSQKEATETPEPRPIDDDIWNFLNPIFYLEYTHVRSPPNTFTNPYENPPTDFEFSDWEEEDRLKISILPLDIRLSIGLIHRLSVLRTIFQDTGSAPVQEIPTRTLTVEECEALNENLPQRRITIDVKGFRLRMIPWDHSLSEKIIPIYLDVDVPHIKVVVTGALYSHRVCSAACQLPKDEGPLWQGARMHISATLASITVSLSSSVNAVSRPVARADFRFVLHLLQHREMFNKRDSITHGYTVKIHEINACGSAARIQAAWHVLESLVMQHSPVPLRHTTLAADALSDEEAVAIDATIEEITLRGFITRNMNTHNCMIQSMRVMAFYLPKEGKLSQAWLFSAPNAPTPTPFLRIAGQLSDAQCEEALDYLGCWTAPVAASVDPLLIAWLAYKPQAKPTMSETFIPGVKSSTLSYLRRRNTPPSSSGRGGSRTGSGSELVHSVRHRSTGSSSDRRPSAAPHPAKTADTDVAPEFVLQLHTRLQKMLLNVELAHTVVYYTASSASALDCATLTDAMERHAASAHHVLAFSTGFITVCSNAAMKHLWNGVKNDGPTYRTEPAQKPKKHGSMEQAESFPWKFCLSEVTCYTLEASSMVDPGREKFGLRSQLKNTGALHIRTVLEPVTTTVTLSVITKTMAIRSWVKQDKPKVAGPTPEELRVKYFTTGPDFKPSTLKEFVRGPTKRRKPSNDPPPKEFKAHELMEQTTLGPVVSIGIHLHADTPPVMVKLEQDQVHTVAAGVHCFHHLLILLNRSPVVSCRQNTSTGSLRSLSELDEVQTRESDENLSESRSDLVPILEYHATPQVKLKKFLWFQWVMGGATLVVSTLEVKLVFAADDIICTIDLQEHYDQFKMKIASASVRHNQKNSNDDWEGGVLGGRVLEAREPTSGMEEDHFLSVTITQAQISNLPESWKEELHPKLLQQKSSSDNMWEIYATLAPLEAVIQPAILENILTLAHQMAPPSFCPLSVETQQSTWQWPFCYVSAGGLRLLITTLHRNDIDDDTFILNVGKISISPYPENPICRRIVNSAMEGSWSASGGLEGHQYEVFVQSVAIQSTVFCQIALQEANLIHNMNTANENPAVKWTQPNMSAIVTTILHPVEVNCVWAPALYYNKLLACGPGLELNLASDCSIDISLEQLTLFHQIIADAKEALVLSIESCVNLVNPVEQVCPYARILKPDTETSNIGFESASTLKEDAMSQTVGCDRSFAADSGVDMNISKYINPSEFLSSSKKTVLILSGEEKVDPSDYAEIFVTMGTIDITLYVGDDDSPEVAALRPPWNVNDEKQSTSEMSNTNQPVMMHGRTASLGSDASRSLTETVRHADVGQTKLELNKFKRRCEDNVPLIHVTLYQPNMYYYNKKTQSNVQISLFNAWIGLGGRPNPGKWSEQLLSTAKGVADPVTDIPPALATVKIAVPLNAPPPTSVKGTVNVEIERPVLIELSADRLRRLKLVAELMESRLRSNENVDMDDEDDDVDLPFLYRLRKYMVDRSVESITVAMSQLGISGYDGTAGWDSVSLQVAAGHRPDRLSARGLVTALLVAAGPPSDCRHVVLQPVMLGMELEATWEAWRRVEAGMSACEPSVHMTVDFDRVTLDVRPSDLATLGRIQRMLRKSFGVQKSSAAESSFDSIHSAGMDDSVCKPINLTKGTSASFIGNMNELEDHFYKDDLKSGAFKIITGSQFPMAYQVTLHGGTVTWRYPHPRTITRIVLFPIPGVYEEVSCVLELYSFLLKQWMPHTCFKLPVVEPREYKLYVAPPDAVFATSWRVRVVKNSDEDETPFEFNIEHYMPREDPMSMERSTETLSTEEGVSAEQLSSALRVDSYFAPRLYPRLRVTLRFTEFQLNAHNSLPFLSSQSTALEGYYVSRPLMRAHRVLSVTAGDFAAHAHLGSGAGRLLLLDTRLSCDVMDCTTGALQQAVSSTRLRAALSATGALGPRARAFLEPVRVALHVPRLRTLTSLYDDWTAELEQYNEDTRSSVGSEEVGKSALRSRAAVQEATAATLEGRVSLWLHNSCASALRVGQEGTDEVVPLGPGARLAYRWRFPTAPMQLRFALAGPSTDWHWSASIPFTSGVNRIRLEDAEELGSARTPGGGVFLHARVDVRGAHRALTLAGRLVLANVLRQPLLYKVRARCADSKTWRSVCSGELKAESVGRSVLCGADCDMVLKIKFASNDTGWSGDIPLKECPKENVPWLVKVPSEGDTAYISVWCRVVRARSDGRVLAAVWPLYVLYSHLPLDTDVLVTTETELSSPDLTQPQARPTPLVQTTPGRGASTHLLAPGTTAARHQLSFQYKDIEYPVTRESIPLHYGVTDTSVFDKRAPVNNIEDVVADIRAWFDRSGHEIASSWPYSVVSSHWYGIWTAAKMQPRCEVTVRYGAVRAGGGCSLEIQLSPVVLLCNAAPLSLTLRAHDAAPLCRLEPGAAIAAPTAVLRKPFFMSVEIGRETFVSSQLQLWTEEPGRYGSPPRGFVALDHAAPFAIQCNHRVALLTLYYEIKHEINVLGVTTTFMIINRLNSNVLVSAIAVPCEVLKESTLEPKSFKVIPQTKEGSMEGEPLPRFYVPGRWRGGDPSELRAFLCLALPAGAHAARRPAPVRLGLPPFRRALHLLDEHNNSVPVVVVQQKHEGRWIVTVSPDPCPQFVVHNRTSLPLAVGEPARAGDDDHSAPQRMQAIQECAGASWWCQVAAGAMAHYSTPSHNARFPPAPGAPPPADPYIIVGCVDGLEEPDWGTSVAAAAASGEQLLQLPGGDMIKLRVHPHPHSTLLELQDVEENDISASDIRRRLQGSQSTQDNIPVHQRDLTSSSRKRSLIAEHVESLILPESERKHGTDVVTSAEVVSSVTEKSKVRLVLLPDKEEPIVEPNEETETDPTNVPPQETKSANLPPQETEQSDVSPQERAPSETKDELEPKAKDKSDEDVVRLTQTRKSENLLLSSKMSVHSNHKTISSAGVKKSSVLTQHSKHSKVTVSIADENKTSVTSQDPKTGDTVAEEHENQDVDDVSYYKKSATLADDGSFQNPSEVFDSVPESDWENNEIWTSTERLRCVISGIAIEMAEAADVAPLLALHVDRAAVVVHSDHRGTRGVLSIADVQVDNLQYSSGQYDFGVVATTRAAPLARDACPPLWSALTARGALDSRHHDARLLLRLRRERWRVAATTFTELSEVELSVGPLALYAEDSYATALAQLARALRTPPTAPPALAEWRALQRPLRLRELHVHPLDLTLTLHTAVRMYIALDQSPLRLSEFRLQDMMTSAEHLTHALTVHYLSAAILGAGWVVGGLELLGAPGALAARVGGATGGVRGVAAAAAAALLRSLSAWAGSLARNLDLLAGDEEHARRAAAARRRAPDSLVAGLAAGITNFAINILGAVGGLAHHPLVSVAVGEAESGATALRRGLLGALAKPLSATADLVAFAGTGLLRQTGWDPVPQPRRSEGELDGASAGWRRDCVRWAFRLAELSATAGFDALLDGAPLRLLLTHKFLVVADPETERIVEMIDFRFCTLGPYQGSIVELIVSQRRQKERQPDSRVTGEDDEYQISAAAMARVARYTGAGGAASEARVLALLPPPRRSPALHAALAAAVHNNSDAHLRLL